VNWLLWIIYTVLMVWLLATAWHQYVAPRLIERRRHKKLHKHSKK
jgi:hypothetical protein